MSVISTINRIKAPLWNALKNTMPSNPLRKAVTLTALPSSGVSNIGTKVLSGTKSAFQTLKTFTTQKTINPLAGVSGAKNIATKALKIIGTGAGVGALFQGSRLIAKAGVSGNAPTFSEATSSLKKGAIVGGAIAGSPLGGIIGFGEGTGINVKDKVQEIFGLGKSKIEDATNLWKPVPDANLPTININYPEYPRGTIQDMIPSMPQNIYLESPTAPSVGYSINPSFSLGGMGGIGENLPLMMALLLGGGLAGGYALGKRKKKKYKKKKNRK